MTLRQLVKPLLVVAALAGLGLGAYLTRGTWAAWVRPAGPPDSTAAPAEADRSAGKVLLTDQAIANLGLTAEPVTARPYWTTVLVPGMVVDRPGQSDRSVVAPVEAVVNTVHFQPGETVRPGDVLFTLRVLSEPFHQSQSDLFKAAKDLQLATENLRLLRSAPAETIAGSKIIEVEGQITRLQVAIKASRQNLVVRGLTPAQIDAIADGTFVREIEVAVPVRSAAPVSAVAPAGKEARSDPDALTFEVQELKVDLGQQVQAGQTLGLLANHRRLAVEGRAFPDETPLLERAVREGWPVQVDFQEPAGSGWPADEHALPISHLANTIDPDRRTFAFRMPLENQSRAVERDGRTQLLWRFRPGQKVRLRVRVGRLDNVFVLPADAVARDGPEAFVFTQNVNTFERRPVRVLAAERDRVVIANDGSLPAGLFVAQSAAAQLLRMAKSQSNAVPKGYHVHADGSLHKNEDEGK